jgi:hypothetical protein
MDQHVPSTTQQQHDQPHDKLQSSSLLAVRPVSSFQDLQNEKQFIHFLRLFLK